MTDTLTTKVAEPEAERAIRLERLLNAPRELVFSAFSSAEHLAHWWGPQGFTITTHAFDFRPGGVWRLVLHGPDGRDYQNRLVFDVVDPPARIVARHDDGGEDVEPARHDFRITLEAQGQRTRLVWVMVFESIAERDRIAREYGADQGLKETVGRLVSYLATLNA